MEFRSHFGVYAIIFNQTNDSILLIKKARGPYTGQYDLPGGSMEDGELLTDTLIREVKEETGCTLFNFYQLKAVDTLFTYMKGTEERLFRHLGVLYVGNIKEDPKTTGDGLDSNGAFWVNLKNIGNFPVTPFVKMGLKELENITKTEK